jgi:hypothetical protein
MSQSPTATTETTTSTEAPAKDSALTAYLKTLDPKAKVNASDKKAAGAKFKEFQAKRKAALEVLKGLETEEMAVAKECLRVFGKNKLTIDGIDYTPSCREERIYYKEMSGKGIEL